MLGLRQLKRPLIWGLSRPFASSRISRLMREPVSIFMLHRLHAPELGVFGHTPEFLCAMLERLRRDRYDFISLERLLARVTDEDTSPMRRAVVFTLDDGYADQGEMASEIFQRYDCPVALFLTTGFVDGVLWPWDAKVRYLLFSTRLSKVMLSVRGEPFSLDLSDAFARHQSARRLIAQCKRLEYPECETLVSQLAEQAELALPRRAPNAFAPLSWERVRDLESKGVRFAPHSVTHATLSRLPASQARFEIESSWARLSAQVEAPLPVFAYPSGVYGSDFGEREMEFVKQAGLCAALSADAGQWNPSAVGDIAHPWRLLRFALPTNIEDVLQYASWIVLAKEQMRRSWVSARARLRLSDGGPTHEALGFLSLFQPSEWRRHEGARGTLASMNLTDTLRTMLNNRFGGRKAFFCYCGYQLRYWLGAYGAYRCIRWQDVQRVQFVCKGNMCRSPFAAALAQNRGLDAQSWGLILKEGGSAHSVAERIGRSFGADLRRHQARRFDPLKVGEGDLVVVMEPGQAEDVLTTLPPFTGTQVTLLGLWADRPRPYLHDPFGQAEPYYQKCFRIIEESVRRLDTMICEHRP